MNRLIFSSLIVLAIFGSGNAVIGQSPGPPGLKSVATTAHAISGKWMGIITQPPSWEGASLLESVVVYEMDYQGEYLLSHLLFEFTADGKRLFSNSFLGIDEEKPSMTGQLILPYSFHPIKCDAALFQEGLYITGEESHSKKKWSASLAFVNNNRTELSIVSQSEQDRERVVATGVFERIVPNSPRFALSIQSKPKEADILVGQIKWGKTNRKGFTKESKVRINIQKDGYKEINEEVELVEDRLNEFSYELVAKADK